MLKWAVLALLVYLSIVLISYAQHKASYRNALASIKVKPILITGASSGLGRALAINLFQKDATLYLCARNKAELEQTADMCRREYIRVALEKEKCSQQVAEGLKTKLADRIKIFSLDLLDERQMVSFIKLLKKGQTSFSFAYLNAGVGF